ncbi:hypothetical protein HPB52_000309 [Rhipicephalus sanguineus]|uniref:Uncharacterized protein n=1 Tax=Rhipicephalus sanguineus TaxID=34632 RepID=A0A9D4PDP9_RHISA|nr:hypothetical protein HPB52_000309 [Rhipicephalus sanguineus]
MSSVIVSQLRQQDRTIFTSVVAAGPSCGLLLIGSLGSILMASNGWPSVFKVTGMLGIGWCFGVAFLMHQRKGVTQSGKALVRSPVGTAAKVPWFTYFRSPSFCIGGGTVSDHLIRKGQPIAKVRKLSEALCQLSKALLLPLVPWCSYTWALLCVSLAVACSGFHNSGVFINPQDIAPLHAGSVFGTADWEAVALAAGFRWEG